jgi:hypothetical protein
VTEGKPYSIRLMTGLRGPKTTRLGMKVAGQIEVAAPVAELVGCRSQANPTPSVSGNSLQDRAGRQGKPATNCLGYVPSDTGRCAGPRRLIRPFQATWPSRASPGNLVVSRARAMQASSLANDAPRQ